MRASLILLLVAVLGALAAHFLQSDPGYVLINFAGLSFQTTVPGLVLILLCLYLLMRVVMRLVRAPARFGQAVREQRELRRRRKANAGLIALAEGKFSRGEKLLATAATGSETPLLHYLNAARAAQMQGALDRRDNWLELARERDASTANAVCLTKAELQIESGQHAEALVTLDGMEGKAALYGQALGLRAQALQEQGNWAALRDLLPTIGKRKILSPEAHAALTRKTYGELLEEASAVGSRDNLDALWASVPKKLRAEPTILAAYAQALAGNGDPATAESLLRKALGRTFNAELVDCYSKLAGEQPGKQLTHVEGWLKKHPEEPALLQAAARLAMRNELFGKARSYLESAMAHSPDARTYALYGQLLDDMGETANAANAWRTGLTLATGDSPLAGLPGNGAANNAPDAELTDPDAASPAEAKPGA